MTDKRSVLISFVPFRSSVVAAATAAADELTRLPQKRKNNNKKKEKRNFICFIETGRKAKKQKT